MKPLCIYHANCQDGFTAAWVVWNAYKGEVELYPGIYQKEPPDVTDREVIMVDFSYKREVVEEMARKASSVLIIDHHKSAIADLANIKGSDNLNIAFDMLRSGAGLAWDFYNPSMPRPPLIDIVEDRDLWKFEYDGTREITARLFAEEYDLETWTDFVRRSKDEVFLADWRNEGAAIMKKHDKDVRELVKVCKRFMTIGGIEVPVASLPYTMTSDAGHMMAKDHPFAACYWDTPSGRVFSLRSRPDGEDVSVIAFRYGGGGHKNAAGFEVPFNKLAELGLL